MVIGGSLLLAFYALFLTGPIRDQHLHDRGRTVDATVVAVIGAAQELHDAGSAEVRFGLPNGSITSARLDVPAATHVGDHIAVVYDPADPSNAVLPFQTQGSATSRFLGPAIGLAAICALTVLLYVRRGAAASSEATPSASSRTTRRRRTPDLP
jgi:hypothetical protein